MDELSPRAAYSANEPEKGNHLGPAACPQGALQTQVVGSQDGLDAPNSHDMAMGFHDPEPSASPHD